MAHIRIPLNIFKLSVKNIKLLKGSKYFHSNSFSINNYLFKSKLPTILSQRYNCSKDENTIGSKLLDVESITGGNPELEHKFKILLLEAEVMRQEGYKIPSADFLKEHHWKELIKMETRSARKKFLEFTFKVEKKKENKAIKKELKRKEYEERPYIPQQEGALIYDLSNNSLFLRIYDSTIDNFYNWRAIQASMFGQKLIIDCGYCNEMTTRENSNCAKQLMYVFSENRRHDDPFDVHFCNIDKNSSLHYVLHRFLPTMYEPWFPINVHESSYLDLFPKEKLVYLTPHCREVLTTYDHDAIYIIGAIVDKVNREPLSLAKAKKEGLKMAKLPLDYYLQWGSGSGKTLAVNHVSNILLDMKSTGDWNKALKHVPRRKIEDEVTEKPRRKIAGRLSFDNDDDDYKFSGRKEVVWKPKWANKRKFEGNDDRNNSVYKSGIDIKKIIND